MMHAYKISLVLSAALFAAAGLALAQQPRLAMAEQPDHGTAAEAKAMLLKAVAAVKADKTKAIDMFNNGEGGFRDRDLYVFCSQISDGKVVAQGNPRTQKEILGKDQRTLKDATGKNFGMQLYAAGKKPEGQITEVSYMFARPGPDPKPVPKVSLVTRVSDLTCGVGYYK